MYKLMGLQVRLKCIHSFGLSEANIHVYIHPGLSEANDRALTSILVYLRQTAMFSHPPWSI